jgi:hypothetical protein
MRKATPTIAEVADGMGMHVNSVSGYLNRLPPSDRAVELLVQWLREHADRLQSEANKLERGLK